MILFFFLRWLARRWKKRVFLSPAVNHLILERCCHMTSSLCCSSTTLSVILISTWDGPERRGSACSFSNSSLRFFNSRRTCPKVCSPQLCILPAASESLLVKSSGSKEQSSAPFFYLNLRHREMTGWPSGEELGWPPRDWAEPGFRWALRRCISFCSSRFFMHQSKQGQGRRKIILT